VKHSLNMACHRWMVSSWSSANLASCHAGSSLAAPLRCADGV